MPCWKGYERVPGTKAYTKGSCRKKLRSRRRSPKRKSRRRSPRKSRRRSPKRKSRRRSPRRRYSYRYKSRRRSPKRKSRRRSRRKSRRRSTRRRSRSCSPGKNKKFAKMVNGKCVRFGDPNMTIKKHKPGRKRSFCARHRCSQKRNKATPGYQSCKKWNCRTG